MPYLLRRTYRGACWKIRRASDNTTQDIYFKNDRLDIAAIIAFCSGTNGFIDTVYDQSGNARNLTCASTSNQPKVYDSSTGLQKASNQCGLKFDGSNHWLQRTADSFGVTGDPNIMVAQLVQWGTVRTDEFSFQIGTDSTGQRLSMLWTASGDSPQINFGGARDTKRNSQRNERAIGYDLVRRAAGATISNTVLRQNGTNCTEATNTNGGNTPSYVSTTGVVIGRNGTSTNTQYYFSGTWCGMVVLASAADKDQFTLEQQLEKWRVA